MHVSICPGRWCLSATPLCSTVAANKQMHTFTCHAQSHMFGPSIVPRSKSGLRRLLCRSKVSRADPLCVLRVQQEIEDEVQAAAESSEGMPGPDAAIAMKTPAALRSGADRLHDQCLQLRSEKRFQQNQMGQVSSGEAGRRPPPAAAASAEAEGGGSARAEPALAAGRADAAAAGSSAQAKGLPAAGTWPTLKQQQPQPPPCGVRAQTGMSAVLGAWPSCGRRQQLQVSSREEAQLRQATAASLQQTGPAQIDLTGGGSPISSAAGALPEDAESQRPDSDTCGICLSPLGDILQVGSVLLFDVALSNRSLEPYS